MNSPREWVVRDWYNSERKERDKSTKRMEIWGDVLDVGGWRVKRGYEHMMGVGEDRKGFQEIHEEDVNEVLVSMEDPLTSDEVLEMVEMVKKQEEEEEATDKPQTAGKELTIPKLKEFM
ncbi:hypothetical protein Hamer_G024414 [Homarus americanus]|uniref:Uncharacterized protein n=1 Tax=Homarus americanus TaxID=6706 RepID=A0A8J5JHV5_HOMAM|nr:hypothetical protein Hamer_G024414 [Homarus americanus]